MLSPKPLQRCVLSGSYDAQRPCTSQAASRNAPTAAAQQGGRQQTSRKPSSNKKVIHWMRHGQTEMNVHLGNLSTPDDRFEDPLFYDTRLTDEGKAQARSAHAVVKGLQPKLEVLIISPLTRALHTAELAFGNDLGCPTVVEPLCSERIWLSSDVGRQPALLKREFPQVSFDSLEDIWWHNNGSGDAKHVLAETTEEFCLRMEAFRAYLEQRPEAALAVVTHFGVLELMTGRGFANCELWSCNWEDGHCSSEHQN